MNETGRDGDCGDYRYGTEAEIREHLISDHGYDADSLTGHSMSRVHLAEMSQS